MDRTDFVLAVRRKPAMLCGPMNRSGKLHALLSTARVANIPSVASNVWLGIAVGILSSRSGREPAPNIMALLALPVAGILLYVSGNFFNDWMDRRWDAEHRPERALPRGLFAPELYAGLALLTGAAGVGTAAATSLRSGMAAAGIAFCILVYTLFHKRSAWAVVPMGLCRALLPVMGSLAVFPYVDFIWPVACGLLTYIMGLSLSARYESMAEPPKWAAVLGRGLLLGTALLAAWGNKGLFIDRIPTMIGVLPYLVWTSLCLRIWKKPVPLLVSRLLAGIPWVDWMVLLPVSLMLSFDGVRGTILLSALCFTIPPLAFASALRLQRLAPAT